MPGRAGLLALGLLALAGGPAVGLGAQAPSGGVEILVTVGPRGAVRVEQRYEMPPGPAPVELRWLVRPCVAVGDVGVERDGRAVPVTQGREGPWRVLRDTTAAPGAGPLRLVVRYDVDMRSLRADVPLLHLATPIPQRDGEREGTVHVRVRFADGTGGVLFPHMEADDGGAWEGRYVAIPSFVRVSSAGTGEPGAGDCAQGVEAPGGDGGLVWRFLLLVGIMGAWVPLYLAWAGRSAEGDG